MPKPQWKKTSLTPNTEEGESSEQLDEMIAGRPYLAGDKFISRVRNSTVPLLAAANAEIDMVKRMAIMSDFLEFRGGERNSGPWIVNPFTCEYVSCGRRQWAKLTGRDSTSVSVMMCSLGRIVSCLMSVLVSLIGYELMAVRIGDRTMIGANGQFYTPSHPIMPEERDGLRGAEWAKPIIIGDDVWIGGGVIVCPGVTIGNGSTVGAGSVVTKDVEERVVVAGNPARVIKRLPPPGETVEGNYKPVEQKEGKE